MSSSTGTTQVQPSHKQAIWTANPSLQHQALSVAIKVSDHDVRFLAFSTRMETILAREARIVEQDVFLPEDWALFLVETVENLVFGLVRWFPTTLICPSSNNVLPTFSL
jgi:hypothetical protein